MAAGLNFWKDNLIVHTGNFGIILFNLYSMGMLHDADRGCTGSNIGVMGGYGTGWSSCSKDDMNTLLQCVLICNERAALHPLSKTDFQNGC